MNLDTQTYEAACNDVALAHALGWHQDAYREGCPGCECNEDAELALDPRDAPFPGEGWS